MSCESSPISTVWTMTTSDVPATVTSVHTTVVTPKVSVLTSLTTSCIATRPSASLPTARLHLSSRTGTGSVIGDSDLATREDEFTVSTTRMPKEASADRKFSLWNLLVTAKEQKRDIVSPRQIPSGLPSNCVSWTIKSSFSTPAATPSTTFVTSAVVTTTQTVIWVPKETIWASCDGTKTVAASSQTAALSSSADLISTSATPESSAAITSAPQTSSVETSGASATDGASSSESEIPSASVLGVDSSAIDPSSTATAKQWIDEASRLSSMPSSLSSNSVYDSTLMTGVSTQNTTSAQTAISSTTTPIVPTAIAPASAESRSPSSETPSSSRSQATANVTLSADTDAATQGALAVDNGKDKAVSVGATIGGIIGLFGLIALILMGIRYYMRWKRGNKRQTLKMRQSWYPPGYDGPDHIAAPTSEKHGQVPDHSHFSFFSMNGRNALSSDTHNQAKDTSRRFPGLHVPRFDLPFFPYSKDNGDDLDNQTSGHGNPLHMPAIFAGPLARMKPTRMFPALATPFSSRRAREATPDWSEKYVDEPIGPIMNAPPPRFIRSRDVDPPRSIMMRPPDFDGVVGPPKLNYEPAGNHMSWGLPRDASGSEALARRPQLEWGHSYAASSINPNPRQSVMPQPPLPRPFVPGPQLPPSPTEESVYSKRESQHSKTSRQSARQSRQSNQNRYSVYSNDIGPGYNLTPTIGLNQQPSSNRSSNPDLRSAILSRASASAASLGGWSAHSGMSERSLPPLPEGGLRFDFPLPPTPGSRAATMVSVPEPRVLQASTSRPLLPTRATDMQTQANMQSSVFEYEDYTRQSTGPVAPSESARGEASARNTIRQTPDWYQKPLWMWDGQSGPLSPIPTDNGKLDGSDWRQSGKPPSWDLTDNVARAL